MAVDCKELARDIRDFRRATEGLRVAIGKMNDAGAGLADVRKLETMVGGIEDWYLEKYLPEFAEKNPDYFDLWVDTGEELENANCFAPKAMMRVSDHEILLGGHNGDLSVIDTDDINAPGQVIDGFKNHIRVMERISDDEILVGGDNTELRILSISKDNGRTSYELSDEIYGPWEDTDGFIASALKVSDDKVLVSGGNYSGGKIRVLNKYADRGSDAHYWAFVPEAKGFGDFTTKMVRTSERDVLLGAHRGLQKLNLETSELIRSGRYVDGGALDMLKISDSEALASDEFGGLWSVKTDIAGIYAKQLVEASSEWQDLSGHCIKTMAKISDSKVLVAGGNARWDSKIGIFDLRSRTFDDTSVGEKLGPIDSAIKISDTEFLVGGNNPKVATIHPVEDLDNLKNALDEIVARSEA